MKSETTQESIKPPSLISNSAHIGSFEDYITKYNRSIDQPEEFWSEVADEFHWYKKWNNICDFNYSVDSGPVRIGGSKEQKLMFVIIV